MEAENWSGMSTESNTTGGYFSLLTAGTDMWAQPVEAAPPATAKRDIAGERSKWNEYQEQAASPALAQ